MGLTSDPLYHSLHFNKRLIRTCKSEKPCSGKTPSPRKSGSFSQIFLFLLGLFTLLLVSLESHNFIGEVWIRLVQILWFYKISPWKICVTHCLSLARSNGCLLCFQGTMFIPLSKYLPYYIVIFCLAVSLWDHELSQGKQLAFLMSKALKLYLASSRHSINIGLNELSLLTLSRWSIGNR